MQVYQVGKLFPHEQYCTGRELQVALPTDSFFNVLISFRKISKREKELFTNGTLTAYLFEQKDIPFLVLDFGEGFSIDISFDTSSFDDEFRRKWTASDGNAITLFLVEASTGILEAMRMIGVGFDRDFKNICSRHVGLTSFEHRVRLIHTAFTTREMMVHAIASTRFGY